MRPITILIYFSIVFVYKVSCDITLNENTIQETEEVNVEETIRGRESNDGSKKSKVDEVFEKKYKPEWSDLDGRPLPRWYDEAKVGIFLHWGVYCVPGFGSEWFWMYWKAKNHKYVEFMKRMYPPGFSYQEFAPMFRAEFFDPDSWAELFAKSGARYVVLTSKHHEGYTLFPSKKSFSWNSVDVGPKRDLVRDISRAVRKQGLQFGIYHSLYEWFNPIYLKDKKTNFSSKHYVTNKLMPDLLQLVQDYKPSIIWADGDWEAHDSYWQSKPFLAWLYNDSPVNNQVVVNDRWGIGIPGHHGDFYNYADRFNDKVLHSHKWENALTIDSQSWGYRKNINVNDILTTSALIEQLVTTVSCGGNVLINVGPTKEGTIAPIFQDRLLALGRWLDINGEAIYKSSPWFSQNDTHNGNIWYTCTKKMYSAQNPTAVPSANDDVIAVYAISLKWPEDNILEMKEITSYIHKNRYKVTLLGNGELDKMDFNDGVTRVSLPDKSTVKSENAWVLKFSSQVTESHKKLITLNFGNV